MKEFPPYPDVEKLIALARGDHARFNACLARRLALWIRSRLPRADPALRSAPCC